MVAAASIGVSVKTLFIVLFWVMVVHTNDGRLYRMYSSYSDMHSGTNEGVYPLHRSKTIHLVRHAQGIHNLLGEKDHSTYLSEELFDAHLTPLGWEQVDNLRKHVHASGLFKNI